MVATKMHIFQRETYVMIAIFADIVEILHNAGQ